MAIIADHIAPNSVSGKYFRILCAIYRCYPGMVSPHWEIMLGFYVSREAMESNSNPVFQYQVEINDKDPRADLYGLIKQAPLFNGTSVTDALEDSNATDLEAAKTKKRQEIRDAKIQANCSYFEFDGHRFQANADAMLQIQTTMQGILARGRLRDDWNGVWLDQDNYPYPIPDVETWYAFYAAIESTGQKNFDRAWALKTLVNAAETVEEVEAIHWNMELPDNLP